MKTTSVMCIDKLLPVHLFCIFIRWSVSHIHLIETSLFLSIAVYHGLSWLQIFFFLCQRKIHYMQKTRILNVIFNLIYMFWQN